VSLTVALFPAGKLTAAAPPISAHASLLCQRRVSITVPTTQSRSPLMVSHLLACGEGLIAHNG
jgi:hypothetical protein